MRLRRHIDADGYAPCINHNDFFYLNFLVAEDGRFNLIDWEYAGMSDPASDFGTFCVCSEFDEASIDRALADYLGRKPSESERRHYWAFVVFAGWCWYVWSLEKEAEGDNVDSWLYIYYSFAADYIDRVLGWYEA